MNFLTIVSFVKKYKGAIGSIAAIVALAVSIGQIYDWIYDKGYDAAIIKVKAEQTLLQEEIIKEAEERMKIALKKQKALYEEELANVKAEVVIKTEVKEVIKYVDREIQVSPDCADLAYDVVSVLSEATRIVTTREGISDTTGGNTRVIADSLQ